MSYRATLRKLDSSHSNLRTPFVEGYLQALPQIDEPMVFIGEPLDPAMDVRIIHTSPVQAIESEKEDTYTIKTLNSLYYVEVKK